MFGLSNVVFVQAKWESKDHMSRKNSETFFLF